MLTAQSGTKSMQDSNEIDPRRGTLGSPKGTLTAPTNLQEAQTSIRDGDGVTILTRIYGKSEPRVTGNSSGVRRPFSTAGSFKTVRRGSEREEAPKNYLNIKAVSNLKNLVVAYELIKSKPGNMTPGIDPKTLDGISLSFLKNTQTKLRNGKFQFPPARRISIPKPGKPEETRPLTIASPRDKIVQKAILTIMENHYEPKFLETSHGFRPGKGTHTAIQFTEAKFNSCKYIIEADFSKAFDSINHDKLMEIIKQECSDQKLIALIISGLKAGYMDEFGNIHNHLEEGTPQGSILSPLLCNIFLHELDKFMEKLKISTNQGTRRKRNKEYEKMTNRAKYMRKKGMDLTRPAEFNSLLTNMINTPSLKYDDEYTRMHYIRYADDFIVGIEGSYKLATQTLSKIRTFVESLGLRLNDSKTGIIDITKEPCQFLGYSIQGPYKKGSDRGKETVVEPNSQRIITRRKKERMGLHLNMEKICRKLENNGFITKRIKPNTNDQTLYRGRYKGNLINLEHADIIRYYNSVIRGIYNYYKIVRNTNQLARII